MFYIGAMVLVLSYYATHNWVFYFQPWEVISIFIVGAVSFAVLAILNVKKMAKKHPEKFLIFLSASIVMLTIVDGVVLSAIIRCVSNCIEGFGWVLTTNKGWQSCPEDLVAGSSFAIFSLVLLLGFCILSIATYLVCNYKKKKI